MKKLQLAIIILIIIMVAVVFINRGAHYIDKDGEVGKQNKTYDTSIVKTDVVFSVRQISFGNYRYENKSETKTESIRVNEGQSFYLNDKIKPQITKPIFKLEKINLDSVQLSHSNEVAFLVNDKVVDAPSTFVLEKGEEKCFTTLWEDAGYKFCIMLK